LKWEKQLSSNEMCGSLLQSLILLVVKIVNLYVKLVAFIPLKFYNPREREFGLEIYE